MRAKLFSLALLSLMHISGVFCAPMSQTPSDQLSHETLRAIRFADVARLLITEDCKYSAAASPEFYSKLCSRVKLASNDQINQYVLHLFRSKISTSDAQETLAFFSSTEGRTISEVLVSSQPPRLSESQMSALSRFDNSSAGMAIQQFLEDPQVLPAVVQELVDYVP